ncbi:Arginine metabolism regulation protein II [Colletotrichum sidae]|uniref:Arginine metabolism regulation protein II n=1 Tax=Colletotrichum sidae TaxID=1347389 RepID=A0A4V3I1P3_9PEZI|nr:Arginine metabolism regulation protein II [Colletotrichum sidae]
MSAEMVDSMGDRSAGDAVLDLDEKTVKSVHEAACLIGPFGVFRGFYGGSASDRDTSSPAPQSFADSPHASSVDALPDYGGGHLLEDHIGEIGLEPWTVHDHHIPIEPSFLPGSYDAFGVDALMSLSQPWMHGEGSGGFCQMMAMDGSMSSLDHMFPQTPSRTSDMAFQESHAANTFEHEEEHHYGDQDCPQHAHLASNTQQQHQLYHQHRYRPEQEHDQHQQLHHRAPTPYHPFANSLPGSAPCLPTHAASLLRYYKSMDSSSSVKGMRISPWQLWLLPCALETFAELSLWNTTSHTRHSILCTLLAKSAFHLHRSTASHDDVGDGLGGEEESTRWLSVGLGHQKDAQSHLKLALQSESDEPSQSKYNEILMAILATAMVSVLYHGSRAVKIFLLDAERLIRLRGLALPRSFNLRVLHHVYTHLRVIAESTDVATIADPSPSLPAPSSSSSSSSKLSQTQTQTQAELAQATTEMAVSLRKFRLAEHSLGAELDVSREKPAEVGYADIHLDVSGRWPATMYPDIYGVPESLMTLLSQTISLANDKSKLERVARRDAAVSAALARHVKTLEQHIWSWTLDAENASSDPGSEPEPEPEPEPGRSRDVARRDGMLAEHPVIRSLALAMHQALIIYFYRRVYNMSAMVIQDAVRKTLDFVEPCLEEVADDYDFATSVGWASFIAACEATTADLQDQGRKILEVIDIHGIIYGADRPSVLAESVWERRRESGDWTLSWPDVMQNTAR